MYYKRQTEPKTS